MPAMRYRESVLLQALVFAALAVLQILAFVTARDMQDFGYYMTPSGWARGTPPLAIPCAISSIGAACTLQCMLLDGWLKRQPLHWLALTIAAAGICGLGIYGIWLLMSVCVIAFK